MKRDGFGTVYLQNITKMGISHQQDYMIMDQRMVIGLIIMKMVKLQQKVIMQMERKSGNSKPNCTSQQSR